MTQDGAERSGETGRGGPGRDHRPPAAIRADIADVERYVREVPPHAASGVDLTDTLDRLRAELRAAESARRDG